MIRVVTIVGARPQFIKAAPVSRIMAKTEGLQEIMIHTGQHYDENMSNVFFDEMEVPIPEINLGLGSGSHGEQTGRMLEAIEAELKKLLPIDWVVVYGDTNSTLAGALASAKLNISVAHIEAGLRSFNRKMPEEINRIVTDHVSNLLFAPTKTAVRNLRNEGIPKDQIHLVGDVMFDAVLFYKTGTAQKSKALKKYKLIPHNYILATIHRAENTDSAQKLKAILDALTEISEEMPVILPIHPRTRKRITQQGNELPPDNSFLIVEPQSYMDMTELEANARLIATDSGGMQKEAYFHQVPCLTLRTETEWAELVNIGVNRLVDPIDPKVITTAIRDILGQPPDIGNDLIYGQGDASKKIVDTLLGNKH